MWKMLITFFLEQKVEKKDFIYFTLKQMEVNVLKTTLKFSFILFESVIMKMINREKPQLFQYLFELLFLHFYPFRLYISL